MKVYGVSDDLAHRPGLRTGGWTLVLGVPEGMLGVLVELASKLCLGFGQITLKGACVKGFDVFPMSEWCTQDHTLTMVKYRDVASGWRELVVASAYFPEDANVSPPPAEFTWLVDFCLQEGQSFTEGCNANAHHMV